MTSHGHPFTLLGLHESTREDGGNAAMPLSDLMKYARILFMGRAFAIEPGQNDAVLRERGLSLAEGIRAPWRLETNKLRNLLIHGGLILYGTDDGDVLPFITHSDMVATALASREYPLVTKVTVPSHKGSAHPAETLSLLEIEELLTDVHSVCQRLHARIERVHAAARIADPAIAHPSIGDTPPVTFSDRC